MKKFLIILVLLISICTIETYGQVKVTNEGFLQVDYSTSSNGESLTFGDNPYTPQPRGRWALEYWTGGLNYWIPWPNSGASSYNLFLEDVSGYVGINEDNPAYHLDVNGDIQLSGQIRYSSDRRLKKEIKDIGSTIDKVKELRAVSYKMKQSQKKEYDLTNITDPVKIKTIEAEMAFYEDSVPDINRYGFIAQELQAIFPNLVDEDEEGYLNVDYVGLIPILVEAINELETKIETLENDCCNNNLKSGSIDSSNGLNADENQAKLYQNTPNPFNNQTTIRFDIPQTVQSAKLHICNMVGTLLKTITITQRGNGNVVISGNEFNAGMYLYSLVNDGSIIDTKQMLLTKN